MQAQKSSYRQATEKIGKREIISKNYLIRTNQTREKSGYKK
jgi:hypothetical protein